MNLEQIFFSLDQERFSAWWEKKYPKIPLAQCPGIGKIKIVDGTFEFDAEGDDAAILPVFNERNDIIDLCAWFSVSPVHQGKFFLFHGFKHAMLDLNYNGLLGAVMYRRDLLTNKPFHVHATPLEWLTGGCMGGCPLTDAVMPLYKELVELTVSTEAMAKRMKAAIAALCMMPKVTVKP